MGSQAEHPRQQLKKHRQRGAFRGEEKRRARLVAELQKARLTGVRFKVPAETMSAKLANLPEGVSVARGRIEVRFDGAEDALARLYSLPAAAEPAAVTSGGGDSPPFSKGLGARPSRTVASGRQPAARVLRSAPVLRVTGRAPGPLLPRACRR